MINYIHHTKQNNSILYIFVICSILASFSFLTGCRQNCDNSEPQQIRNLTGDAPAPASADAIPDKAATENAPSVVQDAPVVPAQTHTYSNNNLRFDKTTETGRREYADALEQHRCIHHRWHIYDNTIAIQECLMHGEIADELGFAQSSQSSDVLIGDKYAELIGIRLDPKSPVFQFYLLDKYDEEGMLGYYSDASFNFGDTVEETVQGDARTLSIRYIVQYHRYRADGDYGGSSVCAACILTVSNQQDNPVRHECSESVLLDDVKKDADLSALCQKSVHSP